MEGENFYKELLKKNLAVGYMKKLEEAVTPDALITIRINYLMTCIPTTKISDNLTIDAGLSNTNKRLSLPEKGAESDEDDLDLPEEIKFEIVSDSEPEESSNENLTGEEPNSKKLCKIKSRSSTEIVPNLINNAVIMENIFKHLPLTDLLNFRTVSTDWDKKIIFHLDRNNRLRYLNFENRNSEEFISLMKSSKQIPFTKFNLVTRPVNGNIQQLLTICGSSIKHLSIAISDVTEKLSRLMPNLESLELEENSEINSNSESEADDSENDITAVFSKLKEIKYTLKTNAAVKTFFKSTPNLKRLEIRNDESVCETEIVADLITAGLLAKITKLHLDTLGESTFQSLFHAASTNGLSLEEFCVNKIDKWIDYDGDYLTEFLNTQGKILRKLEIQTTFQPPKRFITPSKRSKPRQKRKARTSYDFQEHVRKFHDLELKEMVALTSISFNMANDGFFPRTENALQDLPYLVQVTIPQISIWVAKSISLKFCCATVTKLVIEEIICGQPYLSELNLIKSLGGMFPSVKSLEFVSVSPQDVVDVTTVWPALKHLKINFTTGYFAELKDIANIYEVHQCFPCLLRLKDLETLSIFGWKCKSKFVKQHFFIRFQNINQSSN